MSVEWTVIENKYVSIIILVNDPRWNAQYGIQAGGGGVVGEVKAGLDMRVFQLTLPSKIHLLKPRAMEERRYRLCLQAQKG